MAELKHKGCGGVISIDVAGMFYFRTHSIIITPSELRLGVLQLEDKRARENAKLVCVKCEAEFDMEAGLKEVTGMCLVCTKPKSVEDLWVSFAFPCICTGCKKAVSGEGQKGKLSEVFDISLSSMKFTSFVEILKKPIS